MDDGPPCKARLAPGLVEIGSAPLIVHALRRLAAAGVRDVGIIVDCRAGDELAAAVDRAPPAGVAVTYLQRDRAAGPREAVRLAARFSEGAPLVVHSTAGVVLEDLSALLESFLADEPDAMVVRPLAGPDAARDGIRKARVPTTGLPPPVLQILGPRIVEALVDAPEAAFGLAPALAALAEHGRVSTRWVEAALVDESAAAQLEANRRVLERLDGHADVPASVSIQGAVAIDARATVESSTLRGPVAIGAGARVRDAYLGPYTSIGCDATVTAVEIENSIVMSGAMVRHLGVRIEGSVIGRRCIVDRAFELPRALRVHLGDTASLVLS